MRLSQELIYEAMLDDDLFGRLPAVIVEHLGARSCTLHWRDSHENREIFAHSCYFSDDQMATYAADFADHDLWTLAALERPNESLLCSGLVSESAYADSHLYNQWIRTMGDDTFYCLGAVTSTAAGFGIVGVHRGRTQIDFTHDDAQSLKAFVPHLRRMFGMRLRLSGMANRIYQLDQAINSLLDSMIVVDRGGHVLHFNEAAAAMLREGALLRLKSGKLVSAASCVPTLDALIASAVDRREPRGSDAILLDRSGNAKYLSAVPLTGSTNPGCALLLLRSPRKLDDEIVTTSLRKRFGLSMAESLIALRMANGDSLNVIARDRHVTIGTLRSQLRSILSRMGVNRQSQIVGIIASLRG